MASEVDWEELEGFDVMLRPQWLEESVVGVVEVGWSDEIVDSALA